MSKKEKKYLCKFLVCLIVTVFTAFMMICVNDAYNNWLTGMIAAFITCLSGGPMFYYYEKFINEGDKK